MAGAGAAAAGAAAVLPTSSAAMASSAAATTTAAVHQGTAVEGALVAHINDVKSGIVSVMVEGREVIVTDHALVAHLTSKLA